MDHRAETPALTSGVHCNKPEPSSVQLQPLASSSLMGIANLRPGSILEKRALGAPSRACNLCGRRDSKVQNKLALSLQLRHTTTLSSHRNFVGTSCSTLSCTSPSSSTLLRAAWGLCLQHWPFRRMLTGVWLLNGRLARGMSPGTSAAVAHS